MQAEMDAFARRLVEKSQQQRNRALGQSTMSLDEYFSSKDAASEDSDDISAAAESIFKKQTTTTSTGMSAGLAQTMLQSRSATQLSNAATNTGAINKLQVVEKKLNAKDMKTSPSKVLRQFAAVDKENVDLGIEINIMTDKNVEVEVQVEEQDINDAECSNEVNVREETSNKPLSRIRDTNRNRLQRLGALYSNADDLSSPIHRTEAQFHADDIDGKQNDRKPTKPRYDKLAALANTINQWEDDVSPHHYQHQTEQPQQPLPQKTVIKPPPKPDLPSRHLLGGKQCTATQKAKPMQWDRKVIDSLEAQGFQRRESDTVKYSYEYEQADAQEKANAAAEANKDRKMSVAVKSGLVSGRAALFEHKTAANQQRQQTQMQAQPEAPAEKDPTELSLKERMQLFERNKGEALLPKAALSMALPPSKIQQTQTHKKDEVKAVALKTGMECKLKDKLAALAAQKTMSEQKIRDDIQKQRQQDMQVLANRFNKQKHLNIASNASETDSSTQPPTPPPMPAANIFHSKRRSPGNYIDEDSKRAKTNNTATIRPQATLSPRLYPHLSDLDSAASHSDNENYANASTTASVSTTTIQPMRQQQLQTLQPNEDDNDSYMDSSEADDSLRQHVMKTVRSKQRQEEKLLQQQLQLQTSTKNKKLTKEVHYASRDYYFGSGADSSLNSSNGSAGIDDYLDEALNEHEDGDDDYTQDSDEEGNPNDSRVSKGSKGTTASNSFSFRKSTKTATNCQTIDEEAEISTTKGNYMQPITSELSVNQDDDNMVQLVHTVSFYRRQQTVNDCNSTPLRKIRREQQLARSELDGNCKTQLQFESPGTLSNNNTMISDCEEYDTDLEADDAYLVQNKIQHLLDEVCKQQQIIAQTSQALNLCAATVEFSGSTESVEGERHLLVATHRRQACLDEVQRLRVERTLRPLGAPKEKGRLTVKEIMLPLRQDYIRKLAADTISGHHLVCLLKYNENVLATKTVPTLPGLLAVKFPDVLTLNNVYADFRITLEIYGMTAQREVLPHEVKYHINLHKKSGLKTPKKKGNENLLVMPPVQSPAGPHVVRTPALVQYGFAIFSLREIQRTSWSLTQVLGVCPLEGIVHMKVNCELSVSVEHKGFLTMYEDISGFGAWHRRWCYLNGAVLSYWKYPDDEKKKTPMGSIDLYSCISQKVNTAPRDICARLNTMLLECERPAKDTDEETLILVPNGRTTIVRHLLSADTKEEREEWCAYFNKTLTLLRAWGTTTTTTQ